MASVLCWFTEVGADSVREAAEQKKEVSDLSPRAIEQIRSVFREELDTRYPRPAPVNEDLDPRKEFLAKIIRSFPPKPKLSLEKIFREADLRQHENPLITHMRPHPAWKARFWAEMNKSAKARAYVAKIRADRRYLPFEYLSPKGRRCVGTSST